MPIVREQQRYNGSQYLRRHLADFGIFQIGYRFILQFSLSRPGEGLFAHEAGLRENQFQRANETDYQAAPVVREAGHVNIRPC